VTPTRGPGPETIEVSTRIPQRPAGRSFPLIVNPSAPEIHPARLFVVAITLPMVGIGAALALSGYPGGTGAGGAGVAASADHAQPRILLHLATQDARIYREAIEYESRSALAR